MASEISAMSHKQTQKQAQSQKNRRFSQVCWVNNIMNWDKILKQIHTVEDLKKEKLHSES